MKRSAHDATKADYDVLWETVEKQASLRKRAPRLYQGEHIKGRQDRIKPYHDLSRPAQLNIRADEIATITLQQMRRGHRTPTMIAFPTCQAYLLNAGEIQPCQEIKTFRWKWSDFRLQEYHRRRLGMSTNRLHRINWEAFRTARGRLTTAEHAFAIKLLTRWLPTGQRVEKYGGKVTACHRCREEATVNHLYQCEGNKEWKSKFLTNLDNF